jgi:hypothetical protein
MIKDRYSSPKEELIRAIEYSAKHPQLYDALQIESADMSIFEYYCIDILLIVFLFSNFLLLIVIIAIKKICCKRKQLKIKKS